MGQHVSRKLRPFMTEEEARGVPLVGGRRQSAIPGSAPESALLTKERRGKLRSSRPQGLDPIPREFPPEDMPERNVRKKLGRRVVISPRG